jgi:hypothetical protein
MQWNNCLNILQNVSRDLISHHDHDQNLCFSKKQDYNNNVNIILRGCIYVFFNWGNCDIFLFECLLSLVLKIKY